MKIFRSKIVLSVPFLSPIVVVACSSNDSLEKLNSIQISDLNLPQASNTTLASTITQPKTFTKNGVKISFTNWNANNSIGTITWRALLSFDNQTKSLEGQIKGFQIKQDGSQNDGTEFLKILPSIFKYQTKGKFIFIEKIATNISTLTEDSISQSLIMAINNEFSSSSGGIYGIISGSSKSKKISRIDKAIIFDGFENDKLSNKFLLLSTDVGALVMNFNSLSKVTNIVESVAGTSIFLAKFTLLNNDFEITTHNNKIHVEVKAPILKTFIL